MAPYCPRGLNTAFQALVSCHLLIIFSALASQGACSLLTPNTSLSHTQRIPTLCSFFLQKALPDRTVWVPPVPTPAAYWLPHFAPLIGPGLCC